MPHYRLARFVKPCSILRVGFDIKTGKIFVAVLRWLSQWLQQFCTHKYLNLVFLESQEHGGLANIQSRRESEDV